MIRDAIPEDLEPICSLGRRFVEESNLPYTFDYEATRELIWAGIHDDASIILVAYVEDVLAGAVMGYVGKDFCVESSAYMTKLYVEKEFRGIITAKDLITEFEKRIGDAVIVFTSATAGVGERTEKLFVKLFEKSGYHVLGRIVAKEIK